MNFNTKKRKPKRKIINLKRALFVCENVTTLHGTGHVAAKKGKGQLLWIVLMIANTLVALSFIIVVRERFNSDQIVTQIDSDFSVKDVPFPAVTICNFNLVSVKQSRSIENILKANNRTQEEIECFFGGLFHLTAYWYRHEERHYTEILDILHQHYFDLDNLMEEIHQSCEDLLIYCEFNRVQKKCGELFKLVETYEGHCCGFNYNGVEDEDPLRLEDEDFEYYMDQGSEEPTPTKIISNSQAGRNSGLRIVFNVEPEDYPSWAKLRSHGAKILITDPNDFPETTVLYRYVSVGESLDMRVAPVVFISDTNLRRVAPDKRGCWFQDEVALGHTNRYSFETCSTECRMKNYLDSCGCIPYQYPTEDTSRLCEFEDIICVKNMTMHNLFKPCLPECFVECTDKDYSTASDTVPFLKQYYPDHVTAGHNTSELTALHVYYGMPTCDCYKSSLLMDVNFFIATYGGVFSLCFGGSLVTLYEVTYLLLAWFTKTLFNVVYSSSKRNKHS